MKEHNRRNNFKDNMSSLTRYTESKQGRLASLKFLEEYYSSSEGMANTELRAAVKKMSEVEKMAYKQIFDAATVLKDDILELIKTVLKRGQIKVDELSYEECQKLLNQNSLAFKKLKAICETKEYTSLLREGQYTAYEHLFNYLIERINVRFVLFAPDRCLGRYNIDYYMLEDDLKKVMLRKLHKAGWLRDAGFIEKYSDHFKDVFKKKDLEKSDDLEQ